MHKIHKHQVVIVMPDDTGELVYSNIRYHRSSVGSCRVGEVGFFPEYKPGYTSFGRENRIIAFFSLWSGLQALYARVEWFKKNVWAHIMSFMTDCYGTLNPKLHFDLLLFHLAQGLTGSQKILPVTLKISNFFIFI